MAAHKTLAAAQAAHRKTLAALRAKHKEELASANKDVDSAMRLREEQVGRLDRELAEARSVAQAESNRADKAEKRAADSCDALMRERSEHNGTRDFLHDAELEIARLGGVIDQLRITHPGIDVNLSLDQAGLAKAIPPRITYGGMDASAEGSRRWWRK